MGLVPPVCQYMKRERPPWARCIDPRDSTPPPPASVMGLLPKCYRCIDHRGSCPNRSSASNLSKFEKGETPFCTGSFRHF
eukprot:c39404_g1_i1 orf=2-238(-)